MAGARKREDEPAAVSPARAPCVAEGDEEVLAVGGHGGRRTWLIAAVVGIVAVGGLVAGIGSNRSHHPATQVVPSRPTAKSRWPLG